MARFIQEGKVINYRNDTTDPILYGDVVVLTSRIGIAAADIPPGILGAVELSGVFELPAEASAAFTVGQELYWDAANKTVTATKAADGAIFAGIAVDPKAAANSIAYVRL